MKHSVIVVALAAVVAVVAVTGCGVRSQDEPEELTSIPPPRGAAPTTAAATQSSPSHAPPSPTSDR